MSVRRLIIRVIAQSEENLTFLSGLLVSPKKVAYCADEALEIGRSTNMSLRSSRMIADHCLDRVEEWLKLNGWLTRPSM